MTVSLFGWCWGVHKDFLFLRIYFGEFDLELTFTNIYTDVNLEGF